MSTVPSWVMVAALAYLCLRPSIDGVIADLRERVRRGRTDEAKPRRVVVTVEDRGVLREAAAPVFELTMDDSFRRAA